MPAKGAGKGGAKGAGKGGAKGAAKGKGKGAPPAAAAAAPPAPEPEPNIVMGTLFRQNIFRTKQCNF